MISSSFARNIFPVLEPPPLVFHQASQKENSLTSI